MKRLAILGSTGSIGVSTLDVVSAMSGSFEVVALAAGANVERLAEQVRAHRPRCVSVRDAAAAAALRELVGNSCRIVHGPDGALEVAALDGIDLVVSALVGARGLRPTYAAIERGRDIALANKEALVVAGRHMTRRAAETGAALLPVDSEHNALHQCLRGERESDVRRLWLTASGGPFRGFSRERLAAADPEAALRHPTWKMGPKITIDSATLMNKGLEVIEASWLFGVDAQRIRVVVHPTSVVHSMVEFVDGSFKAQLGLTDMRHPIQYALTYPERRPTALPEFDPVAAGPLVFERPDTDLFPCLALAFRALEAGGAAPAVLNAANEVAVEAFLAGRLGFLGIPVVIERALDAHGGSAAEGLEELIEADTTARQTAERLVERGVDDA